MLAPQHQQDRAVTSFEKCIEDIDEPLKLVLHQPTGENAQKVILALRLAFGTFHHNLDLAGSVDPLRYAALQERVDAAVQALQAVQGERYIAGYRERVAHYQHILSAYKQGGMNAVHRAVAASLRRAQSME